MTKWDYLAMMPIVIGAELVLIWASITIAETLFDKLFYIFSLPVTVCGMILLGKWFSYCMKKSFEEEHKKKHG